MTTPSSSPSNTPRSLRRRSIATASELRGIFPALFTPLKDDDPKRLRNSIDYAKSKTMIDELIAAGVDGIVPVGTTGQSPTVSHQQHLDFIRFTLDYVDGRVPVIAGAGSNSTRESVEMIQSIQAGLGEMAVLCVTGYYNNPPQDGIIAHYRTLSRETGARIVIYNVPGRTASYLEADTVIELARDRNIIGIKQAVNFKDAGKHREDTLRVAQSVDKNEFALLSGEDDSLLPILEMGGSGIISASANIPEVARIYREIIVAFQAGDLPKAQAAQAAADRFVRLVFARKNPIPLSAFFNSPLYLPLVAINETPGGTDVLAEIKQLIRTDARSLAKYHPDLS
jgi:4-hydroxy-tetrahydrodipicolinate synthase